MKIKSKSIHYQFYKLLKKIESAVMHVMDPDVKDPFEHYVCFNKIKFAKTILDKTNYNESKFRFFESFPESIKILFKTILLYNLWGSFLVPMILGVVFSILGFEPLSGFNQYILSGVFPIFILLLVFAPFFTTFEFIKSLINLMSGNQEQHKRVRIKPHNVFSYLLYIILFPIYIFLLVFMEYMSRFILSIVFYLIIGAKLFLEIIWLVVNTIFSFLLQLKNIFNRKSDSEKISINRPSKLRIYVED